MTGSERALRGLRDQARWHARQHGLPADVTARLVLAVTELGRAAQAAGVTARLTCRTRRDGDDVVLSLTLGPLPPPAAPADLPLVPEPGSPDAVTWNLRAPAASTAPAQRPAGDAADPTPEIATEAELRALLTSHDTLARQERELRRELSDTNSGVLAMYVELEQRDERLRRAHAEIFRELEDALRPPPPRVPGVELGVHYSPAHPDSPTGGDLYDWFTTRDGRLHVTVVDAVGHGVTSTRSALNVAHAIRTLALEGHPLDSLVARAAQVLPGGDTPAVATALLAQLDPASGQVALAGGGHPPALHVRGSTGATAFLTAPGRGIGFPDPGSHGHHRHQLAPGDLLLLYTDGLTESRKNVVEGERRLARHATALRRHPTHDLPELVVTRMHDVVLHRDDTLLLTVRYTPTG